MHITFLEEGDTLKKKIFDYIIIFSVCFLAAPVLLYLLLNSSLFSVYNLYFKNRLIYLYIYLSAAALGLFVFVLAKALVLFVKNILKTSPVIKAELISIEKAEIKPVKLGIIEIDAELEDVYTIKFKHKNEIINATILKSDIQKDLIKDECPYVEYQSFYLLRLFNKFLNIKVHTK